MYFDAYSQSTAYRLMRVAMRTGMLRRRQCTSVAVFEADADAAERICAYSCRCLPMRRDGAMRQRPRNTRGTVHIYMASFRMGHADSRDGIIAMLTRHDTE